MIDAAEWTVVDRAHAKRQTVRGTQVGRFGVRLARPDETVATAHGQRYRTRAIVVDHIPSGAIAFSSDDFAEAMLVADEFSRFSVEDPDSADMARAGAQIGPELFEWLRGALQGQLKPFREWRSSRERAA